MKKIKILEVTAFSSGICGLWTRVSKEAELLAKKGYEVHVFSSNIARGSGKIEYAQEFEKIDGVAVRRFKTFGKFGDNTFFWNYSNEAIKLNPDIIICHAYRQYYSTIALKIAKKLKIPCILVTHAPFLEKKLRNPILNSAVWIYDAFIGKKIINNYTKIFTITKWEIPHLISLGASAQKIIYIPNGIPKEFFTTKLPKKLKNKKILFLGRIAPIKDLMTLIKAFKIALEKEENAELFFVGPSEEDYKKILVSSINSPKLTDKIRFSSPVYDLKEKIKIIDDSDIFVLPSKREAMPQALIEAMAREKIVISSSTEGGKEIISDGKNGLIFDIGNEKQLADKIISVMKKDKSNFALAKEARKSVEKFSWDKIIQDIDKIIQELCNNNSYKK